MTKYLSENPQDLRKYLYYSEIVSKQFEGGYLVKDPAFECILSTML